MRLLIIPAISFALSALLFLTATRLAGLPESFDEALAWLQGMDTWLWLVACGVILADSFLIMPSDAAMMALGLVYGVLVGGALAGLASVAGGLLAFGVVRALGEGVALRLVGERDLKRARSFFARWGAYAVATARAVGGPAEPVILLAGLSHMAWRAVFFALCLGGIPTAILKAALGAYATQNPLVAIVSAVVLAVLATWLAKRATRGFDYQNTT